MCVCVVDIQASIAPGLASTIFSSSKSRSFLGLESDKLLNSLAVVVRCDIEVVNILKASILPEGSVNFLMYLVVQCYGTMRCRSRKGKMCDKKQKQIDV